jgi:hypothetical protein
LNLNPTEEDCSLGESFYLSSNSSKEESRGNSPSFLSTIKRKASKFQKHMQAYQNEEEDLVNSAKESEESYNLGNSENGNTKSDNSPPNNIEELKWINENKEIEESGDCVFKRKDLENKYDIKVNPWHVYSGDKNENTFSPDPLRIDSASSRYETILSVDPGSSNSSITTNPSKFTFSFNLPHQNLK